MFFKTPCTGTVIPGLLIFQPLHQLLHLFDHDRFHKILIDAQTDRLPSHLEFLIGAYDHEFCFDLGGLRRLNQLQAAHIRHLEICKYHIRLYDLHNLQSLLPVRYLRNDLILARDRHNQILKSSSGTLFIFRNQNPHTFLSSILADEGIGSKNTNLVPSPSSVSNDTLNSFP